MQVHPPAQPAPALAEHVIRIADRCMQTNAPDACMTSGAERKVLLPGRKGHGKGE